jgi:hypothetical protein
MPTLRCSRSREVRSLREFRPRIIGPTSIAARRHAPQPAGRSHRNRHQSSELRSPRDLLTGLVLRYRAHNSQSNPTAVHTDSRKCRANGETATTEILSSTRLAQRRFAVPSIKCALDRTETHATEQFERSPNDLGAVELPAPQHSEASYPYTFAAVSALI